MIILALDSAAKRCGWAILESKGSEIFYRRSGILGLERRPEGVSYQEYRLDLIYYWVGVYFDPPWIVQPDVVVCETLPPVGGNMASIVNRQLGLTAITVVQTLAASDNIEIDQIGASTVKKIIGGKGRATKVQVRNGVLKLLPELEHRRQEWTGKGTVYDEIDAIGVGYTYALRNQGTNGIK